MDLDPEAYNEYGDHLSNDRKQSRVFMWAMVLGAFVSIMFLLWMIFWQPIPAQTVPP